MTVVSKDDVCDLEAVVKKVLTDQDGRIRDMKASFKLVS